MNLEPASLSTKEFEEISRLAYERFGLDFRPGKEALVASRLGRGMRAGNFPSVRAYLDYVLADGSGAALTQLIDSLTTNYTSFLREPAHFELLRDTLLPELRQRQRITVWSAGCSTGEEPYSILFTLLEALERKQGPDFQIVASDISTRALWAAQRGVYAADKLSALPPEWRSRYFQRGEGEWSGKVRIKQACRDAVEFRRVNLMEPLSGMPECALIFCRNVMIYFDKRTQLDLVRRLSERLEPGGHLLIGHSEGLMGLDHGLEYVRPAVYRKAARTAR
jgi:chemotaxis protein methyltransferase CheR